MSLVNHNFKNKLQLSRLGRLAHKSIWRLRRLARRRSILLAHCLACSTKLAARANSTKKVKPTLAKLVTCFVEPLAPNVSFAAEGLVFCRLVIASQRALSAHVSPTELVLDSTSGLFESKPLLYSVPRASLIPAYLLRVSYLFKVCSYLN